MNSKEGFDFLGWRFEVKTNYYLTCFSSRKNWRQMINKIKTTMRNPRKKMDKIFKKVNVIYKGWRNYHQYCDLSKVNLGCINEWVYQFFKKANSKLKIKNRVKSKITRIEKIHDIFNRCQYLLFRHVIVMSYKSAFDNDWMYWSKTQNK